MFKLICLCLSHLKDVFMLIHFISYDNFIVICNNHESLPLSFILKDLNDY